MAKCDQLLGEVDILNLLVKSHYCFLLPSFPLSNQSAIRNLRSNLLDQELWSLALEVSCDFFLCNRVNFTIISTVFKLLLLASSALDVHVLDHCLPVQVGALLDVIQLHYYFTDVSLIILLFIWSASVDKKGNSCAQLL